ncbi:MAG: S8 family serine peptidase [Candidatus Hodarchaeota archaeon]
MTIYPLFKNKLENLSEDQQFRVIISFEDLSKREQFIKKFNQLKILGKIQLIPSIVVNLKKEQVINYEKEELVKNIEEDQIVYPSMLDVIEFLELDDYMNSEIAYSGKNVRIGIIDNGINRNIPAISSTSLKKHKIFEIQKSLKVEVENREISHATIMASIISNRFQDIHNNFIGIAPNVNIIDFDVSDSNQEYSFYHILNVFDKICAEKIDLDILFIPLTTKNSSDGKDILSSACNILTEKKIIIVCPAGNNGPNPYSIGSPAAAKRVITIGALTKELDVPNFSGRGPTHDERRKPDLCFPGFNIKVPITNDLRLIVSGTSVSAALCVGVIALIKEYDPNISYDALMDLLAKTSIDLGYEKSIQGLGTVKVSHLFNNLDLFHEKIIPYNYLIKKSLRISIEFLILLIVLFYFFFFFRI